MAYLLHTVICVTDASRANEMLSTISGRRVGTMSNNMEDIIAWTVALIIIMIGIALGV